MSMFAAGVAMASVLNSGNNAIISGNNALAQSGSRSRSSLMRGTQYQGSEQEAFYARLNREAEAKNVAEKESARDDEMSGWFAGWTQHD